MNGNALLAFTVSGATLVIFAALGFNFLRGTWLHLVCGKRQQAKLSPRDLPKSTDERRALGKRAVLVLLVGFLLVFTLLIFGLAKLAGNSGLEAVITLANNILFILLMVVLIWFFISLRPASKHDKTQGRLAARKRSASLDHISVSTLIFIIVFLGLNVIIGMLYTTF